MAEKSDKQMTPVIRFKGFANAWVLRELKETAESFEYGLNAASTDFDGTNKYIRITDIDDDSRVFKTDSLTSPDYDLSLADNYKLKNGDILFARTGASVGKTYRYREADELVYFAGFLIRARIKKDFDAEFIFQNTLTSSYINFIKITSQRSGQPGVNAQEYGSYPLFIPHRMEQQKLGGFFHIFDGLVASVQRKLEGLKRLKKAYLQQMFPQTGETVPKVRFAEFDGLWEQYKLEELSEITTGKLDANAMINNGVFDFYTSGIKKYKINTPAFNGPAITVAGNGATVGYMHLADGQFNAYQRTYCTDKIQGK